jgi:hypothetical protein
MKKIRITTIVTFIILLGLLSLELYRNWDYSYQQDNTISIIVYSILSAIIFVFYFFIPKFFALIKPFLKRNENISVNDKYISLSERNKTKNILIICISAIICCFILGYSYFISNRYYIGGAYKNIIIDKYNNTYTEPIKK